MGLLLPHRDGTAVVAQVIVFIDAQNIYRAARYAFFEDPSTPHIYGTFNPRKFGELLVARPRPGEPRILKEVRIYTGRPDSSRNQLTYSAHMRQCAAWEALGKVTITARPLRYPRNWPTEREREKGVDVALAIDFVSMFIDGIYDIGILASADTDLVPALETVARRAPPDKAPEVAAWHSGTYKNRLRISGMNIWCHLLEKSDYSAVSDLTDYRPST